ncbi:MAG: phosphodiester glycosidase family protein [Paracoccaceae bacterium]
MLRLAALFALLLPLPQVVLANICTTTAFEGTSFTTCEVSTADDLRIFHSGPSGPLGSFNAVNAGLAAEGKTLGFAMNAGMYHPDRAPVGLLIDNGRIESEIVTAEGPGNFGLLPNGVFCIGDRFSVVESRAFAAKPPRCRFASQSGPMLVIGGKLHPRLIPDSDSTYIRNGVGVSADGGRAVFAISNDRVNFHRFARFFRDVLGLRDALYFDGKISRLYAPAIRRNDFGFAMGPIVGTVVKKD